MIIVMGAKERITIMVDSRILKKLRTKQSKLIAESQKSMSFSKVINEDLAKHYKIANFEY